MSLARIVSLGFRIGIRWAGFFSVALGASAGAVLSFDSSGNFQGIFASGSLVSSPSAVETGNGNVYVADYLNNAIKEVLVGGGSRRVLHCVGNSHFDFHARSIAEPKFS